MNSRTLLWTLLIIFLPVILVGVIFVYNIKTTNDSRVAFKPQQTQLFKIDSTQNNNTPIDVLATTLPQFALNLADGKFQNLWQADAAGKQNFVTSSAVNAKGDTHLQVQTQFDSSQKELILTPQMANKVKPGLYTLNVKVKTLQGEDIMITQDFRWGVLAINTNKAIYNPGEQVKIGMAVLDDLGTTKCITKGTLVFSTAKVGVTITSPSGQIQKLSTDDNSIVGSKECGDRTVTDNPDFQTQVIAQEVGKYTMHMEAETVFGKESIDDFFSVSTAQLPYVIERTSFPTRIYPRVDYPVSVSIQVNNDYSGSVTDIVPSSFKISQISDSGDVSSDGQFETIAWQVHWQKGETHILTYTIHFPPVAPEFYLIGPLHIGQFSEGKEWQIASDSLFQLVQEINATGTGSSNISANFASGVTLGNLIVMNCYRAATTNSLPTISGWTRAIRSGSGQRVAQYYRTVTAGIAGTTTFTCVTGTNTGELGIELMEFSGTATSSITDTTAASVRTGRTCNTNNTTNSVTPSNPDDLIVTISASTTNTLTVSSHTTLAGAGSSGIVDADIHGGSNGFQGSSGAYDGGWGELVNNPQVAVTDTTQWSGGGTCVIGLVAYNASITLSQGSFRFFDNTNAVNPTNPFLSTAGVNANINLNQPNQAFRLRILVDVDSPTGNSIGLNSGDFILQYATVSGTLTCATASYATVSTPLSKSDISFNANAFTGVSGVNIGSTANDPADTPTYTTELQSYYQDDSTAPGPAGGGNPGDISNDQLAIGNNQAGEWDVSLIDNTDDSVSRTYCLRLANGDGSDLNAYRNFPEVTLIHNDVVIRGGSTIRGGTTIQ